VAGVLRIPIAVLTAIALDVLVDLRSIVGLGIALTIVVVAAYVGSRSARWVGTMIREERVRERLES
jgi:hypothetical protein